MVFMKKNDRLPSLDKLQAKIDKIKKPEQKGEGLYNASDMSEAIRMIIDLVVGVIMGTGCGYLLDKWLNTIPWLMIIGMFLGIAAGVKNMLRTGELMDKKRSEQNKDNDKI